jgi:hypothetical protein
VPAGGTARPRRSAVFARSSTIQAKPSMIDAGIRYVDDEVMTAMRQIEGFVGISLMVDRSAGHCVATSGWRTQEAMRASGRRVDEIRAGAEDAFGAPASVEEWEVAVMHRTHHASPGACVRGIWSRTNPSNVERAIDVFKIGALGRIEDLPGFCSASLLVNRSEGRAVVTVGYENRGALDANREAAGFVRTDVAREAGLEVLDVIEFDLEIAHLHIPETV